MPDILVVGATGFTGRLITRYLLDHPQRTSYTLGIGVRSKSKGKALKKTLSLDDSVNIVLLDITRYDEVEAAVKNTNLVINAVGPFWNSGEAIVQACVHHGKKYVDITGEAHFIRELIDRYDELATKTSAIIVPACGFDCVPADLAVYLSNQTLKKSLGPYTDLGLSQTFYSVNFEFSGGSRATLMSMYEDAPRDKFRESYQDYALSPVRGFRSPCLHLPRPVPLHSPPIFAAPYVMAGIDRAVVQRTFGLNQLKFSTARMLQGEKSGREQEQLLRPLTYGSQFRYGEFLFTGSGGYYRALLHSVFRILTLTLLRLPAFRWLLKKFDPKPGQGPSKEKMERGSFTATNFTATYKEPHVYAKTVVHGQGDPAYLLTALMVAECGLGLLLDDASLPITARSGGILTPATALGDVIIQRLQATGKMQFESEIVSGGEEDQKSRHSRYGMDLFAMQDDAATTMSPHSLD